MFHGPSTPYPIRLQTFLSTPDWTDHEATARQLAAIGHVHDPPPLEAGSRCVTCSQTVKREVSVEALEGSLAVRGGGSNAKDKYLIAFSGFSFHYPNCERLQVKIPLDPQATLGGLFGGVRVNELRDGWEQRSQKRSANLDQITGIQPPAQTSSLFRLPVELRLQIYGLILPPQPFLTEIVPLHRDSSRITTSSALGNPGPLNQTTTVLLRTSKQILAEALDLLYRNHSFKFANSKTLYLFLRNIGSHGRARLRAVIISGPSREDAIAFSLLAAGTPKLRSLTLGWGRPTLLLPRSQGGPIWLTDAVAALLELSGLQEVGFGEDGVEGKGCLGQGSRDAEVVRRCLMREKGEAGFVRWVDGCMDL
ncbi:hypothetical protein LTR62_002995 [Meristemomyces frigidus]|uniref:DUF7730 domain-containing protein n=1 Tax=Meristemomyces frigidus TaxID=1508187 RepID=A0AAN7TQ85_9PEZI|nr:hypothetical protein LTR62_002995 [Meristemomyces frigidus]